MGNRTNLQLLADRRSRDARRAIGADIRSNREDQGVSQRRLAAAADVDCGYLARVEAGTAGTSLEVLQRLATALGGEVSVRFFPGTGSPLRDRFQAPIVEELVRALHPCWRPSLEVPVYRPARGVVDVVLARTDTATIVAGEVHSQVRRLEQQIRWSHLKSDSLPSADLWRFVAVDEPPTVSRLLILRSAPATREVVRDYAATIATEYPARSAAAYDSLVEGAPWPGAALLWADVEGDAVRLRRVPPRGVPVGR
jgi:transcriptional regulator with XRE-family HTH domain